MDDRTKAQLTLKRLGIPVGSDYHALRSDQKLALIEEADRVRYNPPKNRNGSRARYFHARLERRATPAH